MLTIPIQDKYVNVLAAFGDIQSAIDAAVRRYTLERITTKITELRQRDQAYQAKYGLEYPAFAERIAADEDFVTQIGATINKLWENDAADWEFCYKGVQD
ncbi:hypothetical protein U27_06525 [Candidatus Vecturithrix granuli]|uniref:Uncharacterized protein n=1 Tax=Vecturithrix granuli TaxID=1499967 RepID=A0A081C4N5_VECG1|nr:hypothetical protein U27_06525 [Candidatus Vecturithrix granuli]